MDEEKFRKINQFNKCFKAEDSPSILVFVEKADLEIDIG